MRKSVSSKNARDPFLSQLSLLSFSVFPTCSEGKSYRGSLFSVSELVSDTRGVKQAGWNPPKGPRLIKGAPFSPATSPITICEIWGTQEGVISFCGGSQHFSLCYCQSQRPSNDGRHTALWVTSFDVFPSLPFRLEEPGSLLPH